jgi:hypothetical protein
VSKLVLVLPELRAPEPPSATIPSSDLDLLLVALVLWMGSVARLVAGAGAGEAFHGEATLALLCVVLIPCWAIWSWLGFRAAKKAKRPADECGGGIFTKS